MHFCSDKVWFLSLVCVPTVLCLLGVFRASLEVMNSLSFCLPEKRFTSLSFLKNSFYGIVFLTGRVFFLSISTPNISYHSLLACKLSAEEVAFNLVAVPLYVSWRVSLAAFRIPHLSLPWQLSNKMPWRGPFGLNLTGVHDAYQFEFPYALSETTSQEVAALVNSTGNFYVWNRVQHSPAAYCEWPSYHPGIKAPHPPPFYPFSSQIT